MRPLGNAWHAYWQWNRGVLAASGGWFYVGAMLLDIVAGLLPRPAPGPARVLIACVVAIAVLQVWLLILNGIYRNRGDAGYCDGRDQ
jgi:hypothetical protein